MMRSAEPLVDPVTINPIREVERIEVRVKTPPEPSISSHPTSARRWPLLDADEFSAREIADQLGHPRPSMAQGVYLGRKIRNPGAVQAISDTTQARSRARL